MRRQVHSEARCGSAPANVTTTFAAMMDDGAMFPLRFLPVMFAVCSSSLRWRQHRCSYTGELTETPACTEAATNSLS